MTTRAQKIKAFMDNYCVYYHVFMEQGDTWRRQGNIHESITTLYRHYQEKTGDKTLKLHQFFTIMEKDIFPTLLESQLEFTQNRPDRPSVGISKQYCRYWFVISKHCYSLKCQNDTDTKVIKGKCKILNSDKHFGKPIICDLNYADKLWVVKTKHDNISAVSSRLVNMNLITLDDVTDILENPSAEGFHHIYSLYYDLKNPHHTTAYLTSIVNIKNKLNLMMSMETDDLTSVHSFVICRNENSEYKCFLNKIPKDCNIIDIDELHIKYNSTSSVIDDEDMPFGIDSHARMIKINQYPEILLTTNTGFKINTTYQKICDLHQEFRLLLKKTDNAIDSTTKFLKKQQNAIDKLNFDSITTQLEDMPEIFSSHKKSKSDKKSSNKLKTSWTSPIREKYNSTACDNLIEKAEDDVPHQVSPIPMNIDNGQNVTISPTLHNNSIVEIKSTPQILCVSIGLNLIKDEKNNQTSTKLSDLKLCVDRQPNYLNDQLKQAHDKIKDSPTKPPKIVKETRTSYKKKQPSYVSDESEQDDCSLSDADIIESNCGNENEDENEDEDEDEDEDGNRHNLKVDLDIVYAAEKLRKELEETHKHYLFKFEEVLSQNYVTYVDFNNLLNEYESKCSQNLYEELKNDGKRVMSDIKSDISVVIRHIDWKFGHHWRTEDKIFSKIRIYKNKLVEAEKVKDTNAELYETKLAELRLYYSKHSDTIKTFINDVLFQNKDGDIVITRIKNILDEVYKLNPDF